MQALRKTFAVYFPLTKWSADFKAIILGCVNRLSQVSKEEHVIDLYGDLAVDLIYSDEVI